MLDDAAERWSGRSVGCRQRQIQSICPKWAALPPPKRCARLRSFRRTGAGPATAGGCARLRRWPGSGATGDSVSGQRRRVGGPWGASVSWQVRPEDLLAPSVHWGLWGRIQSKCGFDPEDWPLTPGDPIRPIARPKSQNCVTGMRGNKLRDNTAYSRCRPTPFTHLSQGATPVRVQRSVVSRRNAR